MLCSRYVIYTHFVYFDLYIIIMFAQTNETVDILNGFLCCVLNLDILF